MNVYISSNSYYIEDKNYFYKEKTNSSKYDYQLIFDLGSGLTAKSLQIKGNKKGLESEIVSLRTNRTTLTLGVLKKLTHHSRIYIIGHSKIAGGEFVSDEKNKFTVEHFTQLFIKYRKIDKNAEIFTPSHDTSKLKISLISCKTADENSEGDSLAKQVLTSLVRAGLDPEVVGRSGLVYRTLGKPNEEYKKIVAGEHQGSQKKYSFSMNHGEMTKKVIVYGLNLLYQNRGAGEPIFKNDVDKSLENHDFSELD